MSLRAPWKLIGVLGLSMLVAACAGVGGPGGWRNGDGVIEDGALEDAAVESSIPRPSKPARIKRDDELGFTITESVRISGQVQELYSAALKLLNEGDANAGIEAMLAVVELVPELTAPHIALGMAYRESGDVKKAEESLKRALILTPEHPVAYNELGILYRKTGRFVLARQSYEKALRIVSDFHYAQRNLGVLCDLFLQDLACALENYQAYQRTFPDDEQVGIWIADVSNRMATSQANQE